MQKPKGISIIDHKIRYILLLSCDEYIMADFICRYNKTHKLGTPVYAKYFSEIGFMPQLVAEVGKSLMIKQIIVKGEKRIETTDLWNNYFNTDSQFDELWKLHPKGTKNEARQHFLKIVQEVTYPVLLEKLQEYLNSQPDEQYRWNLSKFLDSKMKRWENDFSFGKKETTSHVYNGDL